MLNIGERPTVVRPEEEAIFTEACELIWQRALLLDGSVGGRTKVTNPRSRRWGIVLLPLNCHCSSCVVGLAFTGPIGGVMAEVKVDVTSGARCIEESLGVIRG